jgi:hypothetical protein
MKLLRILAPIFLLLIVIIILALAAGVPCIIVKTGMPKISKNIKQAKKNGVFLHEMIPSKKHIVIDSVSSFDFGETWVEQNWTYACKYGLPVIELENRYRQFIYSVNNAQGDVKQNKCNYNLTVNRGRTSVPLCSLPELVYNDNDTFMALVTYSESFAYIEDQKVIDTIYFTRK